MPLIEQTHGLLPRKPGLAHRIPTGAVFIAVLAHVFRFGLQRHVGRVKCRIQEKRMLGVAGVVLLHPGNCPLRPVICGKVAFGVAVYFLQLVAFVQAIRMKIIGLGVQESIELLKPPLQGPGAAVAAFVNVMAPGVVPLAHHHGGVALITQNFSQGGRIVRNLSVVARKARVGMCNPAAAHGVGVLPSQQRSPGR